MIWRYATKRILLSIPLLAGIATLTFIIVHLAPGDPMDVYLDERFSRGRERDPALIELIREKYGLDQPLQASVAK